MVVEALRIRVGRILHSICKVTILSIRWDIKSIIYLLFSSQILGRLVVNVQSCGNLFYNVATVVFDVVKIFEKFMSKGS